MTQRVILGGHRANHSRGRFFKEGHQERVGMYRRDPERIKSRVREVPHVYGDDLICAGCQGRGDDVSIIGVRQGHARRKMGVVRDYASRSMQVHQRASSGKA